jgi:hypothetical protein
MKYLKKFNESSNIDDIKEFIYTMGDIFVDLKDMGCTIEIYPDPEKDVDAFNKLCEYLSDKLDFSDPKFEIYIKGGIFFEYRKTAFNCLNHLKRTLEKFNVGGTPRGLYVSSAKYEYINPHNYDSEQGSIYQWVNNWQAATIIKITKP